MVVFTCAHCGDSLQKPKVAKHYDTKCRNNCPDLCCVDCLKDFRGDEYVAHTKCISEAERYGAKGFVPKASQNKGEKKQDAWIEIVQSVLDENKSLSGSIRFLLEKISNQPNTPRKKIKFVNFVKSMSSRTHPREIDQVWDLLSAKLDLLKTVNIPKQPLKEIEKETTTENSATNDTSLNGEAENSQVGDSKKKRKKQNSESTEIILNGNSHNSDDAALGESKKKKKKQKNGIHEDTVDLPISGSEKTNGISEFKKPKKDNTSEECINVTLDGNARNDNKDNLANKLDAMNIIEKDSILPVNGDNIEEKLSKKELKQKRKREKYEKELKEIESAPSQPCHIVFDDESASKKKNKKRKFEDIVQEPEETPVKLNESLLVAEENDKPSEKKKKKTDAVSEFDWIGAITSVLGSKEKEISLKKLQKRVLAEYCSISGATEISERISKKYSKSLGKIQNVKIENDKARLVINEE